MKELLRRYSGGTVTSRDREQLRPDETLQSTGFYLKPGDNQRVHRLKGRSEFGDTGSSAAILGLAMAQFDSGSDKLLALSGGTVYGATPGTTGSWSSLEAISTATVLSAAHYNDRHYIGLGGVNRVLESDGTLRQMGMQAPTAAPVAVASDTSGGELEADADTEETVTGFDNPELAHDGDTGTFSSAEISTGSSSILELSFADTDAAANRFLELTWSLGLPGASAGPVRNASGDVISDTGAEAPLMVRATVLIEYSENDGDDWTELYSSNTRNPVQLNTIKKEIDTALNLSTTVRVRFTVTHVSGTGQGVFRVYRVRATRGSSTATFTNSAGGMLYAIGEYSATYDLYSPVSVETLVNITVAANAVTITLPTSFENSISTHFYIYRTADGGSVNELGIIGPAFEGDSTFVDDFSDFPATTQPTRLVRTIRIADPATGTLLPFPMDTPPPAFTVLRYYKGSLVGFRSDSPRALNFNIPGKPESWPTPYVYLKFPLPEHDQLITMEENAGSLIIGAKGAIIRMDDLPRASAGVFDAPVVQLKGAPGCVGRQAMASVNVPGHSRVCWISNEGIFITDGHNFDRISGDIDWSDFVSLDKSNWVLHYDHGKDVLYFCYATTGTTPNRYYLFHMDKSHVKDGVPRAMGPHYGKIAHLAGGMVSNVRRLYTGHASDGSVYLEDSGGTDASNSYDSDGTWPSILKSGRRIEDWQEWAAWAAALRHGDFGTGETCTLDYSTGRHASGEAFTRSQSVGLSSQQSDEIDIARGGEWHQETITYTGASETGWISGLMVRADLTGDAGERAVKSA